MSERESLRREKTYHSAGRRSDGRAGARRSQNEIFILFIIMHSAALPRRLRSEKLLKELNFLRTLFNSWSHERGNKSIWTSLAAETIHSELNFMWKLNSFKSLPFLSKLYRSFTADSDAKGSRKRFVGLSSGVMVVAGVHRGCL